MFLHIENILFKFINYNYKKMIRKNIKGSKEYVENILKELKPYISNTEENELAVFVKHSDLGDEPKVVCFKSNNVDTEYYRYHADTELFYVFPRPQYYCEGLFYFYLTKDLEKLVNAFIEECVEKLYNYIHNN